MAQKVKRPKNITATPSAPAPAAPRPKKHRRGWLLVGLILGLAPLVTSAVFAWRQHTLIRRVQAGLPVLPDQTGRPAVLGELLAQVQTKAKASDHVIENVIELGRLYHANNFNREAATCWRLLHTAQPREARWIYYLADLSRTASDYSALTAYLEETIAVAPDYTPARLQLANLQFKSGELDRAERNYQQRLTQLPHDPYARLGLVRLALQRAQRPEARTQLELLLKYTPEFSTGHNLYAELLAADGDAAGARRQRWLGRETGRFREAEDRWLDELQAWCYDYDRLCVLGTIEHQTEHADRAQAIFERAIKLKPSEPAGYELLAVLYLKRNEAARARDILEQALPRLGTRKPSPLFFVNLSHAYRELKQPEEAVRAARQGLALVGDEFELHDALGVALANLGQPEAAIDEWHTALTRNPNDANANFNLAQCLLSLGRLDEALAALDRSLILQPTFPQTLQLRGRLEMDAGHWELAESYLQPLYDSHPEMPEARQLLASWHRHMGTTAEAKRDLSKAEQHYRAGLAIAPSYAELHLSLGALCLMQTRFSESLEPLEAYHRLQPTNAQGCLFLGQAYAILARREEARKILTEGAQLAERSGNPTTAQHCRELLQQL